MNRNKDFQSQVTLAHRAYDRYEIVTVIITAGNYESYLYHAHSSLCLVLTATPCVLLSGGMIFRIFND